MIEVVDRCIKYQLCLYWGNIAREPHEIQVDLIVKEKGVLSGYLFEKSKVLIESEKCLANSMVTAGDGLKNKNTDVT